MTKPITIRNLTLGEGIPKICVPLTAASAEDLCQEARKVKAVSPDLVEWRADFFDSLSVKEELESALEKISSILDPIPLLFTIRTKAEGGNADLTQEDYAEYNLIAAESQKADLIDVEFFQLSEESRALISRIQSHGSRVIASSHDFQKTDSREILLERFLQMDASGADILKMAVMPKEFQDAVSIMQVTSEMAGSHTEKPLISMSMGSLGVITRIVGEHFGSSVTFAAVGAASAPGQLPAGDLKKMLLAVHGKTAEAVR